MRHCHVIYLLHLCAWIVMLFKTPLNDKTYSLLSYHYLLKHITGLHLMENVDNGLVLTKKPLFCIFWCKLSCKDLFHIITKATNLKLYFGARFYWYFHNIPLIWMNTSPESQEVYSMPRRVFFPLPATPLHLNDYMFLDERVSEVKGRVRELLDLDLKEDDLDMDCERPASKTVFQNQSILLKIVWIFMLPEKFRGSI